MIAGGMCGEEQEIAMAPHRLPIGCMGRNNNCTRKNADDRRPRKSVLTSQARRRGAHASEDGLRYHSGDILARDGEPEFNHEETADKLKLKDIP